MGCGIQEHAASTFVAVAQDAKFTSAASKIIVRQNANGFAGVVKRGCRTSPLCHCRVEDFVLRLVFPRIECLGQRLVSYRLVALVQRE